ACWKVPTCRAMGSSGCLLPSAKRRFWPGFGYARTGTGDFLHAARCKLPETDICGRSEFLFSPRQIASLIQDAEGARRGGHEKSVAARHEALDVVPVRMRVTAGDFVFLADRENAIDLLGDNRVLVVSGMA